MLIVIYHMYSNVWVNVRIDAAKWKKERKKDKGDEENPGFVPTIFSPKFCLF